SAGTRQKDFEEKKSLYRDLDVQEYWLFDPKGDWIPEKLRGFRLKDDAYEAIADSRSVPLDLELLVEGDLLRFRHNDTGQILPLPLELARALQEANRERQRIQQALQQEVEARQQEAEARQQEAEARQQAEMELQRYRDRFGALDAE
ncbi:MAG: Uma2 family endonuclease, partial [Cyanobacteria bacterium J06639_1]